MAQGAPLPSLSRTLPPSLTHGSDIGSVPCVICSSIASLQPSEIASLSWIQVVAHMESQVVALRDHARDLHDQVADRRPQSVASVDLNLEHERVLMDREDLASRLREYHDAVAQLRSGNEALQVYADDLEEGILHQEARIRALTSRLEHMSAAQVDSQTDRDALMGILIRHSSRHDPRRVRSDPHPRIDPSISIDPSNLPEPLSEPVPSSITDPATPPSGSPIAAVIHSQQDPVCSSSMAGAIRIAMDALSSAIKIATASSPEILAMIPDATARITDIASSRRFPKQQRMLDKLRSPAVDPTPASASRHSLSVPFSLISDARSIVENTAARVVIQRSISSSNYDDASSDPPPPKRLRVSSETEPFSRSMYDQVFGARETNEQNQGDDRRHDDAGPDIACDTSDHDASDVHDDASIDAPTPDLDPDVADRSTFDPDDSRQIIGATDPSSTSEAKTLVGSMAETTSGTASATSTGSGSTIAFVAYGQHTTVSFDRTIVELRRNLAYERFWAHFVYVSRVVGTQLLDPRALQHSPLNMLVPQTLHLYPGPHDVVVADVAPVRSFESLRRLIECVEMTAPWQHLIENWPDPLSFDGSNPIFDSLISSWRSWVKDHGARILWHRTHAFKYAQFIPVESPTTQAERDLAQRARSLDTQIKNGWSHRINRSRVLLNEILSYIANGIVDSRIFLDPALLILPDDKSAYSWHPDFRAGAPDLKTQLSMIDARDPWRLYYVDAPDQHPVRRYGYDHVLQTAYPLFAPASFPPPIREPPKTEGLIRRLRRLVESLGTRSQVRIRLDVVEDEQKESDPPDQGSPTY